jgi:hypothetical protein
VTSIQHSSLLRRRLFEAPYLSVLACSSTICFDSQFSKDSADDFYNVGRYPLLVHTGKTVLECEVLSKNANSQRGDWIMVISFVILKASDGDAPFD